MFLLTIVRTELLFANIPDGYYALSTLDEN